MKFITLEGFHSLLQPWRTKLSNIISRGVVKRTDDTKGIQEVQAALLADEVRDELENFQQFGFTSNPDDEAECVVVFPGGDRESGFVIATGDRRYRVKVGKGGCAIYDKTGSKVVLAADGNIELTPSTGVVKINGDLVATGDVTAGDGPTAISLKQHGHSQGSYSTSGGPVAGTSGTATMPAGVPAP